MLDQAYDAIVIGGGFFGASLAVELGKSGARTLLLEAEAQLLGRASLINQARVHVGYHYPRSFLTGLRSRANAPRFLDEYRECIYDDFSHYYAISRLFSKVTGAQFRRFCERIEAPFQPAPARVASLFSTSLVETVLQVPEYTFDAVRLRARVERDLACAGVRIACQARATRVWALDRGGVAVQVRDEREDHLMRAENVFNCTYANLNHLHQASQVPIVPLQHELTEMALIEPPDALRDAGVTVMCGPFFSMLPWPSRALHSLSHVRYTPHATWSDAPDAYVERGDRYLRDGQRRSNQAFMIRDAARYLPLMRECRYRESIWEVKTVLPRSAVDDSRPIFFSRHHGIEGFHCVIGSKLDNAYDVVQVLRSGESAVAAT